MPYELPQQPAERRSWHPVVWQEDQQPPSTSQANGVTNNNANQINLVEKPHLRIVYNVRKFLKESENNPELRKKIIEDMLLALPSASKSVF